MNRPQTVWFFTIISFLGALIGFFSFYMVAVYGTPVASAGYVKNVSLVNIISVMPLLGVVVLAGLVADLVLLVFLYKFFNLQRSSLKWAHAAFGLSVISQAFPIVLGQAINFLSIIIALVFWWAVVDYVNKKKTAEGTPLFS